MPEIVLAPSHAVPSRGPRSANQPTRREAPHTRAVSGSDADNALLAQVVAAAQGSATEARSDQAALRYLESSRLLVPPPAPLDPGEQAKLTQELADVVAQVITTVLDGLGLSDADWERGRNLAMEAVMAVTQEGWVPL